MGVDTCPNANYYSQILYYHSWIRKVKCLLLKHMLKNRIVFTQLGYIFTSHVVLMFVKVCSMVDMESSNSASNMKQDIRSAKFDISESSYRNCSGLSSGISGLVDKCSFINSSSSGVARWNQISCTDRPYRHFRIIIVSVNFYLQLRISVGGLPGLQLRYLGCIWHFRFLGILRVNFEQGFLRSVTSCCPVISQPPPLVWFLFVSLLAFGSLLGEKTDFWNPLSSLEVFRRFGTIKELWCRPWCLLVDEVL